MERVQQLSVWRCAVCQCLQVRGASGRRNGSQYPVCSPPSSLCPSAVERTLGGPQLVCILFDEADVLV
ncbi:unnamed protein product [Gadus morhua 'NCC']